MDHLPSVFANDISYHKHITVGDDEIPVDREECERSVDIMLENERLLSGFRQGGLIRLSR